jgi:hypothetical protein
VLALTEDEEIYGWGCNEDGQLGLGDTTDRDQPSKLTLSFKPDTIFCSAYHSLAIARDGQLYVWGYNADGELGIGDNGTRTKPQPLDLPEGKVLDVANGGFHTVALMEEGHLYLWGRSDYGQLGQGDTSNKNSPQKVTLDEKVVSIACGSRHTFAFTEGGEVYVWGKCNSGELGLGHNTHQQTPQLLKPPFKVKKYNFTEAEVAFPESLVTLESLLETGNYSDIVIHGQKLHKCIIHARCPKFLDFDFSEVPESVVSLIIRFLYTNSVQIPENPMEICELLRLAKVLEIPGLTSVCHRIFLRSLTPENAYPILTRCVEFSLETEIDWVCWFIGKNKVIPSSEVLTKFATLSPLVLSKVVSQGMKLTLNKPKLDPGSLTPVEDDLEKLVWDLSYADLSILVCDKEVPFHSCLLSQWGYFKIIQHDKKHTPEMPLESFRKVIRYLYTGKTEGITFTDAGWISSWAPFYLLNDTPLEKHCQTMVSSKLDGTSWMEAFLLGTRMENKEIQQKALEVGTATAGESQVDLFMRLVDGALEADAVLKQENEMLKMEVAKLRKENEELKKTK